MASDTDPAARPAPNGEQPAAAPRVEVVHAAGKPAEWVGAVVGDLLRRTRGALFVTRSSSAQYQVVRQVAPAATYHPRSGLVVARRCDLPPAGSIAVVTAGTSDLPVAEEAAVAAEALGMRVERLTDVGVAGHHRLLAHRRLLQEVDCVVVVAGMEGALATLVTALVACPVIAVPTSVGYGTSFGGLAALLAMLSSCNPGMTVVNVDNGVGAAVAALRIVQPRTGRPAESLTLKPAAPASPSKPWWQVAG
jgi:NCAIR mutase (PurE)-related protein